MKLGWVWGCFGKLKQNLAEVARLLRAGDASLGYSFRKSIEEFSGWSFWWKVQCQVFVKGVFAPTDVGGYRLNFYEP